MDLALTREQIPTCAKMTYLNTGWSGPSPTRVLEAIERRLRREAEEGPTSPPVLEETRQLQPRARQAVAALLNASVDEVWLTQSTTDGLNTVLSGLHWRPGDEIIAFDLEHPSVLIPCFFLEQRHGVRTRVLPLAPDESPGAVLEKIGAAIAPRTRMVFVSHIQYASGLRLPLQEIRALTKDRGILLLVDGAQTAGQIALDMRALDCDFYAISGHKWLLGPDGTGALYIRRELLLEVEPVRVGSRSIANLGSHPAYDAFEPNRSSIEKFGVSTTSAALWAGLTEAVAFVQEAGLAEVEKRSLALAARAKTGLARIPGVTLYSPVDAAASSGLVAFGIEGLDPRDAVERLWREHRIVARSLARPSAVRLSLAFFNTEDEVDQAVEAVRRLRQT